MSTLEQIDRARPIPHHIAIIMDGNGRWAKQRGMIARLKGHEAGSESVRAVLRACDKLDVRYLTLFAFSTENWKRPKDEVDGLMYLLKRFLDENEAELIEKNIRLRTIGRIDDLPAATRASLDRSMDRSRTNTKLDLILALSYGSRQEIVAGVQAIATRVRAGEIEPAAITEETIRAHLFAPDVPDPDLLIRTSGEMRISNFLLWQISYAELYVTPVLWPDFKEADLYDAVVAYQQRSRRFGDVGPKS